MTALVASDRIDKAAALAAVDDLLGIARARLSKVAADEAAGAREQLLADVVPDFEADVAGYFLGLVDRVTGKVRKVEAFDFDPETSVDWTVEDDELETILARWYTTLGNTAYSAVSEQLSVDLTFDLQGRDADGIREFIANQVTGINETTRERLRTIVVDAVDRGISVDDFEASLRDTIEGWASTPDGGAVSRAHSIALTETANGYNQATVAGYAESGLVDEVEVFDGPDCGWTDHDDPDLADGSTRTLDDAQAYPIAHPHCQRAFGAVVAQ